VQTAVRESLDPTNTRTAQAIPSTVYLMNHVSCRAILVECGFLSNPEEDQLLQQKAHQQKLAMILASAYLTTGDGDEALI
jgi:N-acetylmuramoyl-L-alanine amidase